MVVIFALLFSNCAYPAFFFRYSIVSPEMAFQVGFLPLGDNNNLYQHVTGASCFYRDANSKFVSTSSSESMAIEMANADTPIGSNYYLYQIRPTANFYNSMNSIQAAMNRTNDDRFFEVYLYYMLEEEWLAEGGIRAEQIHSAREYQSNGPHQEAILIREYQNEAYIHADSVPNNSIYRVPDLPLAHIGEQGSCSVCDKNTSAKKSKRSIRYDFRLWLACNNKYLEVFFGE